MYKKYVKVFSLIINFKFAGVLTCTNFDKLSNLKPFSTLSCRGDKKHEFGLDHLFLQENVLF